MSKQEDEQEQQQKQPLSPEMIDLEPKYSVAVHEALDVYIALGTVQAILRFDVNALQQLLGAISGLCEQQQRSVQEALERIWIKLQSLRKQQRQQQQQRQQRDPPKSKKRAVIGSKEAAATRQLTEALIQKLRLKMLFSALHHHVQLKKQSRRLALVVPNMKLRRLCRAMFGALVQHMLEARAKAKKVQRCCIRIGRKRVRSVLDTWELYASNCIKRRESEVHRQWRFKRRLQHRAIVTWFLSVANEKLFRHATAWARRLTHHARSCRLLREWRVLLARRNELREQINAALSNRKAAATASATTSNREHVRHLKAMLTRSFWDSRRRLQRQFLAEISSFAMHICDRLHSLQDSMAQQKASAAVGAWSILSIQPGGVDGIQSFAARVLRATAEKHGGVSALVEHFQHVCTTGANDQRQLAERLRRLVVVEEREHLGRPQTPSSEADSQLSPLPSQRPVQELPLHPPVADLPNSPPSSTSDARTLTLEEKTFVLGLVKRARHAIRRWKRVTHLTGQSRVVRENHNHVVQRKAVQAWTVTFRKQLLMYTYADGVFAQAAKRRALRLLVIVCLEQPRHRYRVVAERSGCWLLQASITAWAELAGLAQWHRTRAHARAMRRWRIWLSRRKRLKRHARRAQAAFAARHWNEAVCDWRRQTANIKLLRRVFDGAFARREALASLPRRHSEFHLLRDMLLAWLEYAQEAKATRSSEAGERKATLFYEAGIAARTFVAWSDVMRQRTRVRKTAKLVMVLRAKGWWNRWVGATGSWTKRQQAIAVQTRRAELRRCWTAWRRALQLASSLKQIKTRSCFSHWKARAHRRYRVRQAMLAWKAYAVSFKHEVRMQQQAVHAAWEIWRDALFARRQKRIEQQRPETSVPVVHCADLVDARANLALLAKEKRRFKRIRSLVQPNRDAQLSAPERALLHEYLRRWYYKTVRRKCLRAAARVLTSRVDKLKASRALVKWMKLCSKTAFRACAWHS